MTKQQKYFAVGLYRVFKQIGQGMVKLVFKFFFSAKATTKWQYNYNNEDHKWKI